MDEPQNYYVKQKKPDIKQYILYDFIYTQFKISQKYSTAIKVRIVVLSWGYEWRLTGKGPR